MIYEYPPPADPIRQGDIFVGLPRADISLRRVPILAADGKQLEAPWEEIAKDGQAVTAVLALRPVAAIVASQDCDTTHGIDVTLCEIQRFPLVEPRGKDVTSPHTWTRIITQHARVNQKWFYLPPDEKIGFVEKMAVDFRVTLRVLRTDLEELRSLRKGRLCPVADEHFRERIAEFFRRYPYDEWYPLNREELETYKKHHPDARPFPWQETLPPPSDIR